MKPSNKYPKYALIRSLPKKTGLPRSEIDKVIAYLREKDLVRTDCIITELLPTARITAMGIDFLSDKEKIIKTPVIAYCPLTGSSCDKTFKMQPKTYFVAHPFTDEKKDHLRKAIENALKKFDLDPYYADIEIRSVAIACKICERISCSKFGIFDISGGNPNVMFELGIAWGFGKKALLITAVGTEIPDDLRGLDLLKYDNYKYLTKELKTKIKSFVV